MKTESRGFLPRARCVGLITKNADGELLIYDQTRDRAHCLNETAAVVWKLCDGNRCVSDIAKSMGIQRLLTSGHQSAEIYVVELAIDQLSRAQLLEKDSGKPACDPATVVARTPKMQRREAIKRIALGTAIALPTVVSLTAPTPAEASVSCKHHCDICTSPIECCGTCSTAVAGCSGSPRCT